MHTPESLLARLDALGIETETVTHPPVMTVEAAKAHRAGPSDGPGGAHTKNLFLKDKKGQMFLVTVDEDRAIDLKSLRAPLGAKSLSFASPERLRRYLGVEPGSVTPFALINDTDAAVRFAIDRDVVTQGTVHLHPLVNTRTTAIRSEDLLRFLDVIGHSPLVLDL